MRRTSPFVPYRMSKEAEQESDLFVADLFGRRPPAIREWLPDESVEAASAQVVNFTTTDLHVTHCEGTLPVVLTCPHDGGTVPSVVTERRQDKTPKTKTCRFQTVRDRRMAKITRRVAQTILSRTGLSPYVVIAEFKRQFIDANRPKECAYTHPSGAAYYEAYHSLINKYAGAVVAANSGGGFLFDMHGTAMIASDPADIYLGTGDGATLTKKGFGRGDLFASHGLHGLLKAAHYGTGAGPTTTFRISPADASAKDRQAVSGGYTVRRYSSVINCVQIEVANTIRDNDKAVDRLVDALSWALVNFVRRHVPF